MTKQFESQAELLSRAHALEDEIGDLRDSAHAIVLAQAFRQDALERALNLSIAVELGQMLPELLELYDYISKCAPVSREIPVGELGTHARAYGDASFPAFAVRSKAYTYMVVLEPLPPLVREAYPDIQQWAVHLRMCTKSVANPAPTDTPLDQLRFLGDFRSMAERPCPKKQTYFREWDNTDRGFLASTEPTTGAEQWTPSDATLGVGLALTRAVMKDLWSHCDFVRSTRPLPSAEPAGQQLDLPEEALA